MSKSFTTITSDVAKALGTPVSYTNLDVYKRQRQSPAVCISTKPSSMFCPVAWNLPTPAWLPSSRQWPQKRGEISRPESSGRW